MKQLTFNFVDNEVPIPECAEELLKISPEWKTVKGVADEIVREAKIWLQRNPVRDVEELLPPEWNEYVRYRLNLNSQPDNENAGQR